MCLFIASLPNLQWSCAVVELKFIPLHVLRHRCDMLHHQCNMCYLFFIFQIFHPCPIWYVFLIPISLFTAWQICLPKCIIIHWWQANKRSQVVIVNGYSPSMDCNSVFYNIACYDQVRGCCVPNCSQNYKLFTQQMWFSIRFWYFFSISVTDNDCVCWWPLCQCQIFNDRVQWLNYSLDLYRYCVIGVACCIISASSR